ncbi:MAG: hypothetical protein ACM30G_03340 [Micromonosporaceae bacterium]
MSTLEVLVLDDAPGGRRAIPSSSARRACIPQRRARPTNMNPTTVGR